MNTMGTDMSLHMPMAQGAGTSNGSENPGGIPGRLTGPSPRQGNDGTSNNLDWQNFSPHWARQVSTAQGIGCNREGEEQGTQRMQGFQGQAGGRVGDGGEGRGERRSEGGRERGGIQGGGGGGSQGPRHGGRGGGRNGGGGKRKQVQQKKEAGGGKNRMYPPHVDWWPVENLSDEEDSMEGIITEGGREGGQSDCAEGGPQGGENGSNENVVEEVRRMLEKCFDRMVILDIPKFAKFKTEGNTVSMSLPPVVEQTQIEWMKENAVVVFFQGKFKSVSADRKEECIRGFEDSILPHNVHHKDRGRVHLEGRNVMSYFPRDKKNVDLMLNIQSHKIKIDNTTYKLTFKRWTTQGELESVRMLENMGINIKLLTPCTVDSSPSQAVMMAKVKHYLGMNAPVRSITSIGTRKIIRNGKNGNKVHLFLATFDVRPSENDLAHLTSPKGIWCPLEWIKNESLLHANMVYTAEGISGDVLIEYNQQLVADFNLFSEIFDRMLSSPWQGKGDQGDKGDKGEERKRKTNLGSSHNSKESLAAAAVAPNALISGDGETISRDTTSILEYARLYFLDILTSSRPITPDSGDRELQEELWASFDTRLPAHGKLDLDRPISLEELTVTLKGMKKGKCPGSDGLPVEYYQCFWEILGPELVTIFDKVLEGQDLGQDMRMGIISLLYKKGDRRNILNWRPISLLNTSYKILAKTLANRLKRYLAGMVGVEQAGFVRGRNIMNNIMLAVEALETMRDDQPEVIALLLDLEKAYDRVNWQFVLDTLKLAGFGESFCVWVRALYTKGVGRVMVNGDISEPFQLSRSLRQGCPLAPMLFVLQMEVLMSMIRKHPGIRGLRLGNGKQCKASAMADDLFALSINTEASLGALKECLDKYSKFSEALVNWSKSVAVLRHGTRMPVDWGLKCLPAEDCERFLGVQVGMLDGKLHASALVEKMVISRIGKVDSVKGSSILGRTLFLNTSVFSSIWYPGSIKHLEKKAYNRIRSLATRYLWKGSNDEEVGYIAKVAWRKIIGGKEDGGLGVLDPESQVNAFLARWVVSLLTSGDDHPWGDLAFRILQKDWGLSRSEDVCVALLTPSFVNSPVNSPVWKGILAAWKRVLPSQIKEPVTREEILAQHIFENKYIFNHDGLPWPAGDGPGQFGRAWIQRGISRITDLWNTDLGHWRSPVDVRTRLHHLHEVPSRVTEVINSIPQRWKDVLCNPAPAYEDSWIRGKSSEGAVRIWKVQGCISNSEMVVRAGSLEQTSQGALVSTDQSEEEVIALEPSMASIVIQTKKKGKEQPKFLCPMGILPAHNLKALPLDWGWQLLEPTRSVPLLEYKPNVGYRAQVKTWSVSLEVKNKWTMEDKERGQPLGNISSRVLRNLWRSLRKIHSAKFSSLAWLQSHRAVPTANWLSSNGMPVEVICCRCRKSVETATHLWWECIESKRIWKWWAGLWAKHVEELVQWDERFVVEGILYNAKQVGRSWVHVASACRAAIMNVIWTLRNDRLFRNKFHSDLATMNMVLSNIRSLIWVDWRKTKRVPNQKAARGAFYKTWGLKRSGRVPDRSGSSGIFRFSGSPDGAEKSGVRGPDSVRSGVAMVETAAAETEAVETGAMETASVDTAAVETATVDTAAVETGAVETAVVDTAAVETATVDTVAVKTAGVETPTVDTAGVETAVAADE
ncbi:hypothetical protein CBR_g12086 [Chara braunii]|uniref:Reverse transcriptase domain-containing protein n=1 Tax=Chara braunii TaxID=69332 RepID=A0A388KR26_CHABU|nr:hypothetical protein CBR_g12086 [Chara braunii]|eukprot:GBG72515.1 hypothetical protein CBR_g12086 [Chara braunii]